MLRLKSWAAAALAVTVVMAGCNGGGSGDSTATGTGPTPVISAVGTPVGAPVSAAVDASGATLVAGHVTLKVPAGAVSAANVTLQPVTDTLNGTGQGIEISADAAWTGILTLSMPIPADETDPEALALAVQQPDGSWRALWPNTVDLAAGTISAGLPANTDATAKSASQMRPQAAVGPGPKRITLFKTAYLSPNSASLGVNETHTFTPYARVDVRTERFPDCDNPPRDTAGDPLVPLYCWLTVTKDAVFYNTLAGFDRHWDVNDTQGGTSTVGVVVPKGVSNGEYTAPTAAPTPSTVTVRFTSTYTGCGRALCDPQRVVSAKASVRIIDKPGAWVATTLTVPTQNVLADQGGVAVSATMLPGSLVRFDCVGAPGTALTCQGSGALKLTSASTPGAAGCVARMDPPSLTVDIASSPQNSAVLRLADPTDPTQVPGDYEAWIFVHWDADVIIEQDPGDTANPCKFARTIPSKDLNLGLYMLDTGNAGVRGVTSGTKVLSGQCIGPSGGLGLGGECSGTGPAFAWKFEKN